MKDINEIDGLKRLLSIFVKDAKKIVIMGIGNYFRSDDAAGLKTIELLEKKLQKTKMLDDFVTILNCESSPESFLGKLENLSPSHVILIDAVQMNSCPGSIGLFGKNDIFDFITTSTHNISPKLLFTYIEEIVGAKVVIIGIQPKNLNFGRSISSEIYNAANIISDILVEVIKNAKITKNY
ncbi:MAG: hydrogenase 3 maturation endopeptidase HyCI [Candidatus Methanomethylicia archaeon]